PTSEHALAARFGICESYYNLSPRPELDQEYTYSGIAHCESVASNFPDSPPGGTAAEYRNELRDKLAAKVYNAGRFYMRRRAYDAAVVYLRDVVNNFPQTRFAPMAIQSMMEAYEIMGYVEDAEAQRER